jgi:hypothetical protein
MNNATWNDLKGKVMAVHGPNIDWWDVRHQVDVYLTGPFQDRMSAVDAFNSVYRFKPIPYRNNNPDGSPSTGAIIEIAAQFAVVTVVVLSVYAALVGGIMLVTALTLGGIAAIAGFFRR